MLVDYTSLEETSQRFKLRPEIIWNLSLRFQKFLLPILDKNGIVSYSPNQRTLIKDVLRWQKQGFSYEEIEEFLSGSELLMESFADISKLNFNVEKEDFSSYVCIQKQEKCRKNMLILSSQIKFLYKQLCTLQNQYSQGFAGEPEPELRSAA
jgi:DNA-binding transcriptional MerR regulator